MSLHDPNLFEMKEEDGGVATGPGWGLLTSTSFENANWMWHLQGEPSFLY